MTEKEKCHGCGSEDLEYEICGDFKNLVCQDCSLVMGGGDLVVEAEEAEASGEDVEVME